MAGLSTAALGLSLLAGAASDVQAGLLDALFGGGAGASTYDAPNTNSALRYYDEDVPRARRRSGARDDRAPTSETTIEIPPVLQSATCCKHGEDPMRALLNDDTLVRGDVVMTPDGLRSFVGSRAPHSARDFQPVGRSTTISSNRRKELLALDR